MQAIVEQAMAWLAEIRKREGDVKWLELVETLRSVTEGKVCGKKHAAWLLAK